MAASVLKKKLCLWLQLPRVALRKLSRQISFSLFLSTTTKSPPSLHTCTSCKHMVTSLNNYHGFFISDDNKEGVTYRVFWSDTFKDLDKPWERTNTTTVTAIGLCPFRYMVAKLDNFGMLETCLDVHYKHIHFKTVGLYHLDKFQLKQHLFSFLIFKFNNRKVNLWHSNFFPWTGKLGRSKCM